MTVKPSNKITLQLCPRCESHLFLPYDQSQHPLAGQLIKAGELPYPPALSRASRNEDDAPIYVCSPCGTAEGMMQFYEGTVIPPEQWPIKGGDETDA